MTKVEFQIDSDGKMKLQSFQEHQKKNLFNDKLRIEDFEEGMEDFYVAEYENGEQKKVWSKDKKKAYWLEGDKFIKIVAWQMNESWFHWYTEVQKYEPRLIKVFEMRNDGHEIVMPIIKGVTLKRRMTLYHFRVALDILYNVADFSEQNNMIFLHHDLHFSNFMIEEKSNKLIMIDPDSFHFYNEAGGWLAGQYVPKNPDKRWVSLGKPEKEGHWTQE